MLAQSASSQDLNYSFIEKIGRPATIALMNPPDDFLRRLLALDPDGSVVNQSTNWLPLEEKDVHVFLFGEQSPIG